MCGITGKRLIALILSFVLFAAVFVWDMPISFAEEPPVESPTAAPTETAEPEPTEIPVETPVPPEEPSEVPLPTESPVPSETVLPEMPDVPELPEDILPESAVEPAAIMEPCATSGDYDYTDNGDGTVTITGYHGAGGDVTVPSMLDKKTVTKIGSGAFENNPSLIRLNIPDGVKTIQEYSVNACFNLAEISLPSSITSIAQMPFVLCDGLVQINVDASNTYYASEDGVLFNKAKTILICYPACNPRNDYNIPNGVFSIEMLAFCNSSNLNSITIPEGVHYIQAMAFYGCTQLQSMVLPESVEFFGGGLFHYCTSLASINIPKNLRYLNGSNFRNCTSLENISVDPANAYFESVDGVLFNKSQSELYCCPAGKSGIYSVPDTVTTIKTEAFSYCADLTNIVIPRNMRYIERNAFWECIGIEEMDIPEGVTRIEISTFKSCSQLQRIILPSSLTYIGTWAFENCINLSQITIPASVTTIEEGAFRSCSSIIKIDLPEGITSLKDSIFENCTKMEEFIIPQSVTTIGKRVFQDCTNLKNVIISEDVRSIGELAFENCVSLEQIDIPSQVKSIGWGVFQGCEKLKSMCLPTGLLVVESSLFSGCMALNDVLIPQGVTRIERYAFEGCINMTDIVMPDSITNVVESAFSGCSGLETVTLSAALESIEQGLFSNCIKLKHVNIPASVKSIGKYAFMYCESLNYVGFSEGLSSIGESAFMYCEKLSNIVLPDSIHSIGVSAFEGCNSLTVINIPKSLDSIQSESFYQCKNLQEVIIPEGISSIGDYAFSNSSIKKLVIPEGVTQIGRHAFSNCRNFETVSLPASIILIENEAFEGCEKLYSAFFSGNAPNMGEDVFMGGPYYFTVFYREGSTGFSNLWYGYPTSTKDPTAVYKVKFDTLDGNIYTYTGVYNMQIYPDISPREHYSLNGWYPTSSCDTAPISMPYRLTGNATLYAKWWAHPCWVSFNALGAQIPSVSYKYGDVIMSPPIPDVQGYYFAGWYPTRECNTVPITFPYTVTANEVIFYAKLALIGPYLDNISLSAGSLSSPFTSGSRNYKITLGENEPSVTITPIKHYYGSSYTINGKAVSNTIVTLANGKSKTVTIKVKYGKKTNTYKFTVTRAKSADNNLASLTNSAGVLSQPFDPNVTNYALRLDENTSSVTLKAAKANVMAKVSPASKKLTLKNGQTKVLKFTVKAQSGAKKTYTVTVTRAPSTNTNLKTLKAGIQLSPGFNAGVTDYTVTLPADKGAVTISAKAFDRLSKVTINGAKKSSLKVTLANGQSTTVSVVVSSQAGTTKEYRISIQRP